MVNKIEKEDDFGVIQQVSGGFGDSMTMDDETRKRLLEIEAHAKLKQCQPIDKETWDNMEITEEYTMES